MSRKKSDAKPTRCAIYTRKSTEEGLEQEYNTLDAQRDAGEAYVKSQQHEGWSCLLDRYDDGGFTGANMERPALKRLLADIEAGNVDCVVVYKVDRLSRSLLDFGRIMETFDKHDVSFVSVTQAFNTASSMGRLMLNVLLSFAQFEREMISERTRDKIAAARRKGKWSGGMPVLGYTVVDTKLVMDAAEANQVRQIFEMYLERQSLLAVAKELASRGWRTKRWTTKKGTFRGGREFDKGSLHKVLTNPVYVGKVRYKDEVHEGEHEPLVDEGVFERVQVLLQENGHNGGRNVRNKHGALLRGLLRCAACDCAMSHSFSTKGNRQYRYYVCTRAQKQGWDSCPAPSIPAGEIESFVVDQICCIGRDPGLVAATLAEVREQTDKAVKELKREKVALERQRRADEAQLRQMAVAGDVALLAEIQERVGNGERRLQELNEELTRTAASDINDDEAAAALSEFDAVWDALRPAEKARVLELLIKRIDHDGERGSISITFHSTGIKALMDRMAAKEAA